jgi:hypothetical protein
MWSLTDRNKASASGCTHTIHTSHFFSFLFSFSHQDDLACQILWIGTLRRYYWQGSTKRSALPGRIVAQLLRFFFSFFRLVRWMEHTRLFRGKNIHLFFLFSVWTTWSTRGSSTENVVPARTSRILKMSWFCLGVCVYVGVGVGVGVGMWVCGYVGVWVCGCVCVGVCACVFVCICL